VRDIDRVTIVGRDGPRAQALVDDLLAAALLVVETRASALAEAGDVVLALAEGALDADGLHELADVAAGQVTRAGPDQITVFKSVGLAVEDLAIAVAAARSLAAR
jgi:ornithine cyclodeaminase